jgi:hypothetical protein
MSYFVCGRVTFSVADHSAMERIARSASMQALKLGACVQFGCAIVQDIVFEIVGRYDSTADWLPFLLTDSPLSNVSEELVSPRELYGPEGDTRFRRHAALIAAFLRSILTEREVSGIDLFVSDAFDDSYPTRTITPESIERELLVQWERREGTDFSFCLRIAKESAGGPPTYP